MPSPARPAARIAAVVAQVDEAAEREAIAAARRRRASTRTAAAPNAHRAACGARRRRDGAAASAAAAGCADEDVVLAVQADRVQLRIVHAHRADRAVHLAGAHADHQIAARAEVEMNRQLRDDGGAAAAASERSTTCRARARVPQHQVLRRRTGLAAPRAQACVGGRERCCACPSSASPASLSVTRRVVRWNSGARSALRAARCAVRAPPGSAATARDAARKLSRRAASTKQRSDSSEGGEAVGEVGTDDMNVSTLCHCASRAAIARPGRRTGRPAPAATGRPRGRPPRR